MADWTDINDSQLDPDAPLTSELAYAWRDNPVAIAEGAGGAPRIQPAALSLHLGAINTGTNESSPAGFVDLEEIDILQFTFAGGGNGSNQVKSYRGSTNNGSTWTGWTNFGFGGSAVAGLHFLRMSLRGGWLSHSGLILDTDMPGSTSAPHSYTTGVIPSGWNAIQFRAMGWINVFAEGRSVGL